MRVRAVAVILLLAAALAAQRTKKPDDFRTWGKVSLFHIAAVLPTAEPLSTLASFPASNFTYALYPTSSSGADGGVPGDIMQGTPRMIPVQGGLYDHHDDPDQGIEFQIVKTQLTPFAKAPGGQALLVFGALYTGGETGYCTGIVQVLELDKGRLTLTDQVSYDCRGGGSAEYDPAKHKLTVRSARYNAGDKPCCPSQFDVIEFKLDGLTVKPGDINIE